MVETGWLNLLRRRHKHLSSRVECRGCARGGGGAGHNGCNCVLIRNIVSLMVGMIAAGHVVVGGHWYYVLLLLRIELRHTAARCQPRVTIAGRVEGRRKAGHRHHLMIHG